MASAIWARLPQPSAVAMAMPRTSPMAQPVRQCRVAEAAVDQEESWCAGATCSMFRTIYPRGVRWQRYRHCVDIADRQRAFEDAFLSPLAVRSYPAVRAVAEDDSPVRTPFQRDRD